jgi:hypothetical protein
MLTKRIELRVPQELFNVLRFWARQRNATISDLVRDAVQLVYKRRVKERSPLASVLGIINDKELSSDIDKHLYGVDR